MKRTTAEIDQLCISRVGRYILTNDHGVIGRMSTPIRVCRDSGSSSFEVTYPDGNKAEVVVTITEI